MAVSKGVYSLYNGWIKKPEKENIPELPDIKSKYSELENKAKTCDTVEDIDNFLDDIYRLRQNSLLVDGEFGEGNLCFKELRNNGIIQDLKDKKVKLENKEMSLEESFEKDIAEKELKNDFDDLTIKEFSSDDNLIVMYLSDNNTGEYFKVVIKDPDYDDENNLSYQIYNAVCDSLDELDQTQTEDFNNDENCNLKESGTLEEASEEDNKAKALAKYLDISVEAVDQDDSDENYYSTPEGDYLIYTDEEANKAVVDNINNIMNDIGLDAFTKYFQEFILNDCLDWNIIDRFIDYEIDYYETQEEDQEMADNLRNMSQSEELDYIKDIMGNRFYSWLLSEDAIDMDKVIDECINSDGRGHFIATYDGDEIELGNNLFAYRVD